MKVLLVQNMVYVPARGGANKSNRMLLEDLARRGHECSAVTLATGVQANPTTIAETVQEITAHGAQLTIRNDEVIQFSLAGVEVTAVLSPPQLQAILQKQIEVVKPDCVLVSTSDPSCLTLAAALEVAADRVVVLVRNTLHVPFGPDCAYPNASGTEFYRRAARVVAVSEYVRDYVTRWAGRDAVTLPISLYEPREHPNLGRWDGEFVTLINPCAIKGLPVLAALSRRLPHVQFAAVPSWGTTAEDLELLAGLENVTLLEATDRVDDLYARTRVLLVPSLWGEARPRVVVEAMLRGIPVMASNVGGIPEAMMGLDYLLPVQPIVQYQHSVNERAVPDAEVPEQDIEPWVRALTRLIEDQPHYVDLGERARDRAHRFIEGWTLDQFEQYLTEFTQQLSGTGTGPCSIILGQEWPTGPGSASLAQSPLRLFEEQVKQTPEALAVLFGSNRLTYAELNQRAEDLAAGILHRGLAAETLVGICLSRTPDYLVSILGVWKAGAAYLPLDPTYPRERIAVMIREARPVLILSDSSGLEAVRDLNGPECVTLGELAASGSSRNQPSPADPCAAQLAYVIYTSGSTGQPKAAGITHGNVAHYIQAANKELAVTREDLYLHTASFSFSSSVRQWAVPLCHGAAICLLSREECQSPISILRAIRNHGATIWDTLAPVWRSTWQGLEAVEAAEREELLNWSLRLITFSGGVLNWEDLRPLDEAEAPLPRLLNIWGNTESIGGTVYRIPENRVARTGRVPIGNPLPGTAAYLIDGDLRAVTRGGQGEICFFGPTVGLGYLNDEHLTEEKFLRKLPTEGQLGNYYRTGDLAFINREGALEWTGRLDDQIKIRGFRVEVGEIESKLREHPQVREAAATLIHREGIEPRLVAAVQPSPGTRPAAAELITFLSASLPQYMIPVDIWTLDQLPRLPNGKLDRQVLSQFEVRTQDAGARVPVGDTEARLCKIWAEVLRTDRVQPEANFFALGGHSLLSVILLDRIEREFGRQLPLSVFLHAPTIALMAPLLQDESESCTEQNGCLVALNRSGSLPPLFLVHGVGGGVLNYRQLAELLGTDQPSFAIQAPALAGLPHQRESIPEMAARYLQEVRRAQPNGPYFLGGQSFGGKVAYEMAQQLRAAGEEVALVALLDTRGPGYPRFRPPLERVLCHLHKFLKSDPAGRREYLRVRTLAVREKVFRSLLFGMYRKMRGHHQELPGVLRDIGLSHSEASHNYRRLPYGGPVVLFRASEQPVGSYEDPYCGWRELVQGTFEVLEVPGDHVSIVEMPFVTTLAEKLREALASAREGQLHPKAPSPDEC